MVAMKNLINNLDILSVPPEMKVKGNSRFITNFGILVSSLAILVIIFFAMFAIIEVFSRKKFNVIYNLDNREMPIIPVNQSQTALLLLNPLGYEIPEHDRYFSIRAGMLTFEIPSNSTNSSNSVTNYSYDSANNSTLNLLNLTNVNQTITPTTASTAIYLEKLPKGSIMELPIKSCRQMKFDKFQEFYGSISKVYQSSMCIDFSGLNGRTLYGKYGSLEGYSVMNIYIIKCTNSSLLNKTNCYPDDVINKKLSQVFISLITIENDVDSNNFEKPIHEFYNNDILPISSSIFKNFFKNMNSIKYKSDDGLILNQTSNYESYRTDAITESVDLRGANSLLPGTMAQITFRCSGKTELYFRNYMKIPSSFGEIGGILHAVLLIGRTIVYFFSKNSMLYYLILQVFDKEEINHLLFFRRSANVIEKTDVDKKLNFTSSPMNGSDANMDLITKFNHLKKISEGNNNLSNVKFNKFKLEKLDKGECLKSVKAKNNNLYYCKTNKNTNLNFDNQNVQDFIKNKNLVSRNFSIGKNDKKEVELIKIRKPSEDVNYNKSNVNEVKGFENKDNANKNDIHVVNNKSCLINEDNEDIEKDKFDVNVKVIKNRDERKRVNLTLKNGNNLNSELKDISQPVYKMNNNDNSELNNLNEMQHELKERSESKLSEKLKVTSNSLKAKDDSLANVFSFAELFCFKELIYERRKRNFMKLSNDIIDKKISLEYLLKYYSSLEKIKLIILNKEQQKVFSAMPNFCLEKHVNEIIRMGK